MCKQQRVAWFLKGGVWACVRLCVCACLPVESSLKAGDGFRVLQKSGVERFFKCSSLTDPDMKTTIM